VQAETGKVGVDFFDVHGHLTDGLRSI